jgi:hypothetical protein
MSRILSIPLLSISSPLSASCLGHTLGFTIWWLRGALSLPLVRCKRFLGVRLASCRYASAMSLRLSVLGEPSFQTRLPTGLFGRTPVLGANRRTEADGLFYLTCFCFEAARLQEAIGDDNVQNADQSRGVVAGGVSCHSPKQAHLKENHSGPATSIMSN